MLRDNASVLDGPISGVGYPGSAPLRAPSPQITNLIDDGSGSGMTNSLLEAAEGGFVRLNLYNYYQVPIRAPVKSSTDGSAF